MNPTDVVLGDIILRHPVFYNRKTQFFNPLREIFSDVLKIEN